MELYEQIVLLLNQYPALQVAEILNIDPDSVEQVMEDMEDEVVWNEETM